MRRTLGVLVVCYLALAVSMAAAPPKGFKAEVQAAGSVLALTAPVKGAVGAYLIVAGPNDFRVERAFTGNEPIALNLGQLKDAQGEPLAFADGDYKWELRLNTTPSPEGAAGAPAMEVPGSPSAAGPKVESWVASGRFKVQGGGIIPIVDDSRGKTPTSPTVASSSGTQGMAIGGSDAGAQGITVRPMTTNTGGNFFSGNLFSSGGVCSGCPDGDSNLAGGELLVQDAMPYVTLRDTDSNQLWRFFSITGPLALLASRLDYTSSSTPLVIEKDTPSNTLYVDSAGAVGIGTSTPSTYDGIQGLDIVQPDYPAVRLNQSGSATKFDLWANASFFGIYDEAMGTNPFLLDQGAPDYSFVIASSGNIGIGTSTPTYQLHAQVPGGTYNGIVATSSDGSGTGAGAMFGAIANWGSLGFQVHGSARTISRYGITLGGWAEINQASGGNGLILATRTSTPLVFATNTTERVRILSNGNVGIGTTTPTHLLDVGSSGAYCNGGAWVDGSSREYKQGIRELSGEDAAEAFAKLNPVRFEYKAMPGEERVGFIAEDVPGLVATKDRKGLSPMDVVAVLTKVVQDQKTLLEEQQKAIAELKQEVAELKQRR